MRKLVSSAAILCISLMGLLLGGQAAHAEYFGMLNGRSGDLRNGPKMSIEAGFMTGDYGRDDYDLFGARFNFRAIPGVVVYADLGKSDISQFLDGNAIGFGAYYQLQDLIPYLDASIKASYHKLDLTGFGVSQDLDALSLELLVSGGEPIMQNGLAWYANAGIHRLASSRSSTSTEPGIGAGLQLPLGPGEVYFGADFIDELLLGGGFRFRIR